MIKSISFVRLDNSYFGYNEAYWSLLPEVIFYLAVPVIFKFIKTYYYISIILYFAGVIAQIKGLNINVLLLYPLIYNCFFALGAFLYDSIADDKHLINKIKSMNMYSLYLITFALFISIVLLAALQMKIYSWPLSALLAIWIMLVLLSKDISPKNILFQLFRKIGLFSFSLYLYHYPFLLIAYVIVYRYTNELFSYNRYYWFAVPVIIVICYMLYLVTEKKSIKYFKGI